MLFQNRLKHSGNYQPASRSRDLVLLKMTQCCFWMLTLRKAETPGNSTGCLSCWWRVLSAERAAHSGMPGVKNWCGMLVMTWAEIFCCSEAHQTVSVHLLCIFSLLYVLQGGLAQQQWRVSELLHRLLAYLEPKLTQVYKNVRERIGR